MAWKGVGRERSRGRVRGRGRGDGLLHSDRNGEGGAGPVEQHLAWDDEDVAAPERQGFFPLYKTQMLISLMPATNWRGVIFLAVLYSSCCQSNSSLHQ